MRVYFFEITAAAKLRTKGRWVTGRLIGKNGPQYLIDTGITGQNAVVRVHNSRICADLRDTDDILMECADPATEDKVPPDKDADGPTVPSPRLRLDKKVPEQPSDEVPSAPSHLPAPVFPDHAADYCDCCYFQERTSGKVDVKELFAGEQGVSVHSDAIGLTWNTM